MGAVNVVVKPQEFFRERITEAKTNQQVDFGDDIEFYLVNLLCEFIAPGKLATIVGELDAMETPLALMLKQALEAPPVTQLRIYKYLGDTSLYVSGYFQDYFNRKAFDVGYYMALGASAYGNVSTLFRDHHGDEFFAAMYGDLSEKFKTLVDVVAEVAEQPATDKPLDLLAVYDRWTRSNSERLRRILQRAGITPIPTPHREKQ